MESLQSLPQVAAVLASRAGGFVLLGDLRFGSTRIPSIDVRSGSSVGVREEAQEVKLFLAFQ